MTPEVAEIVRKEMEAVISKLTKRKEKLRKDRERALCGPPGGMSSWTEKQRKDYFSKTSQQRVDKSVAIMQREIDCEFAIEEIHSMLFMHHLRSKFE